MKKGMRKNAAILFAAVFSLSLTGCQTKEEPVKEEPVQTTEASQTEVPADDGRGDLIRDENDTVPVLMGGALPFSNMQTLESENREDGTYYYADVTEDGQIMVVNTVEKGNMESEVQSLEDYLTACALDLSDSETYSLETVEEKDEYTEKMSYPVYVVTYTSGENEDTRQWTVFAMDTDQYTYLYGFCATLDAAEEMEPVYQDIFSGLYLSDGEGE